MTTRTVKILPRQTYNHAVKACVALVEADRLYRKTTGKLEEDGQILLLADSKYSEALAHAKKVIANCEGE